MSSKVVSQTFIDRILGADQEHRDRFRKSMARDAEKWFKIVEYLIIVGLLKVVLEKMEMPDRLFTGLFYLGSYIFWFFYSMNVFFDLLAKLKISPRLSPYMGGLIGLILGYMAGSIATKLTL